MMSSSTWRGTYRWCWIAWMVALVPTLAMAQNLGMGETYESFDGQAQSLTLHFSDARVVAERRVDGSVEAVVLPAKGDSDLSLTYRPNGQMELRSDRLQRGKGRTMRKAVTVATADWVALQAYVLWTDLANLDRFPVQAERLGWTGDFVRPKAAKGGSRSEAERHAAAVESRLIGVETDFGRYRVVSQVLRHP